MKKAKKVKKTKAKAKPKKAKAKAKAKPAKKAVKKAAKPAKKKVKVVAKKAKVVAKKAAKVKPVAKNHNNNKNNHKVRVSASRAAVAKRAIDLPVPMASKPAPVPIRKEDTDKQLYLAQKPSIPLRIPVKSVLPPAKKSRVKEVLNKSRYNDKELEEFRLIILKKITEANKELENLQEQMTSANEHGTDDTANTFKVLEDGSDTLAKEEAGQLAARQKKFIEQLENALIRIENKTYGICRVTGKLIPKERLRAVPHTTQSIEAKLSQYRD
jgi:RNA polymerase-binding transcription factor DksA